MIDRATVQRILDAADIVEVVSDYVHLVRRGANYMGLCPFHNERTPSFSVNKARNFCFCFSCKKGGSPVSFIMEKEGLSYREALLQLAKKYGIKVEEKELSPEEINARNERESMLVANEWAASEMSRNLTGTEEGRDIGLKYLYGRGITQQAVKAFRLGYAIDRGDSLVKAARLKGFEPEVLWKLGLIGKAHDSRHYYDKFRGRVIFPIQNTSGKVIAFGGRDLKGGPAKYINSPESDLYKKSNELYGIFQAKGAIVRQDKCFLVEGYMDVIGMWQSGLENVVASSGTALTDGQINLIHRFTNRITLIYDGDAAGIKASLRGIDMLLSHKMEVKVLLLPDGHDPDSFARENTPEDFRRYVAEHETDIIRFKVQVLMQGVGDDPQRRIAATQSIVTSLANIPDDVARNIYIQECSSLLGVEEATIAAATARERRRILEGLRRDRAKREFPVGDTSSESSVTAERNSFGSGSGNNPAEPQAPGGELAMVTSASSVDRAIAEGGKKRNPLEPLEREIVRSCLKYGLFEFGNGEDTDDPSQDARPMNVAEYVATELRADDLWLSELAYSKTLEVIIGLRGRMEEARDRYMAEFEKILDARTRERIDEIGSMNLGLEEIKRREKKLDEEIGEMRRHEFIEFSRNFLAREMTSMEDDDVRNCAIELLRERNQLSNIFLKGREPEDEMEKVGWLVPRNLLEFKTEVLNLKIHELVEQLSASSGLTPDEIAERQKDILTYMKIRSTLAKNIGERIIFK